MSGMLGQEQPHSLVSTTMQQHNTSRPATEEERGRVLEFLLHDYLLTQWGLDGNDPQTENDAVALMHEPSIQYDLARVEDLVEACTMTIYPNYFPDGAMIELRVWDINFLNTFQNFKQSADGTLTRHEVHHTAIPKGGQSEAAA